MNSDKPPVLCIVGPTATGKSDFGVIIARAVNGEVLSADSMQVYRGMDIGTAKLTVGEMQGVPHHLIDLVNPDVPFTVADWVRGADAAIADIVRRGRVPIVVGGTGLYIKAITEDLDFAEQQGSQEVREKWGEYAARHGNEALHRALSDRDPASAQRLHPNDTRRVIRALEVFELGRGPLSQGYDWQRQGGRYRTLQFGLSMPRETLYNRVNQRVDAMMQQGLLDEVRSLLDAGYDPGLPSMQAIGYKELVAQIQGQVALAEAVEQLKMNTRRFVKRQLSWFRRDSRVVWIDKGTSGILEETDIHTAVSAAEKFFAGIQR